MTRSDLCIDQLFRDARTHNGWLDKPVSDKTLREVYDALKWGPTSANASPGRFVFVRTAKGKERLRPSLAPGNVEKTMAAPVTLSGAGRYGVSVGISCGVAASAPGAPSACRQRASDRGAPNRRERP